MIDVHSHVPTHRDSVPPDELVVNHAWRPDRPVAATTTWADYAEAFADVELSVAFTIARNRTEVDPALNDAVAAFVADAPSRRIGFLSIHPEVDGALDELERARTDLGLQGIKLGPNYQVFDPLGEAALAVYAEAERRGLPILFHQGASPVRDAPLRYAHPLLMDEIAIRFPELRVVMAHLGHPWQRETVVVLRKNRNVFGDVSAAWARPLDGFLALVRAQEWDVVGKLLFGSDYPMWTPAEAVAGLRELARMRPQGYPAIRPETVEWLVEGDPRPALGLV